MVLLALLAAMMLVGSPVLAHQGGPHHGNKYYQELLPEWLLQVLRTGWRQVLRVLGWIP